MNAGSQNPLSFLYIIPLENGRGTWQFPSQLRQNLFQNFVRVKGLFSKKSYGNSYNFVISNASEHMDGKKTINNVLGVFNHSKENLFQLNGTTVTAPINVIPSSLKFTITDQKFKKVPDFEGFIWVEIFGSTIRNLE